MLIEKEILTPDELQEALEKGISWLEWYYDEYSKNAEIPLFLEYNFKSKNLMFENIPITWKIDKIEIIESPVNSSFSLREWQQLAFFKDTIKLVDYKTWKVKTLWQIKWLDREWNKKESGEEWKYFRQLLFYKLLCETDFDFSSKYDIWNLAIDFVEWKDGEYKQVLVDFTKEDFDEFKELVKDSWQKINDLEFWKKVLEK
jgi:hypothetical protein